MKVCVFVHRVGTECYYSRVSIYSGKESILLVGPRGLISGRNGRTGNDFDSIN